MYSDAVSWVASHIRVSHKSLEPWKLFLDRDISSNLGLTIPPGKEFFCFFFCLFFFVCFALAEEISRDSNTSSIQPR